MEYTIIGHSQPEILVGDVNHMISRGWQPLGGITSAVSLSDDLYLYQAMTRTEKKKVKPLPFTAIEVVNAWNAIMTAKKARSVRMLSEKDRKRIESLTRKEFRSLEDWREYFESLNNSHFVKSPEGNWKATLEWALRDKTMTNLINGAYNA